MSETANLKSNEDYNSLFPISVPVTPLDTLWSIGVKVMTVLKMKGFNKDAEDLYEYLLLGSAEQVKALLSDTKRVKLVPKSAEGQGDIQI